MGVFSRAGSCRIVVGFGDGLLDFWGFAKAGGRDKRHVPPRQSASQRHGKLLSRRPVKRPPRYRSGLLIDAWLSARGPASWRRRSVVRELSLIQGTSWARQSLNCDTRSTRPAAQHLRLPPAGHAEMEKFSKAEMTSLRRPAGVR